jgi:hypothetical protein
MWSASGDEGGNQSGVSTISRGRLQYIRWVTAGHTQKTNRLHTIRTEKKTQKWAKFTYSGNETGFVTKILKKAGLHIAFTTRQTIGKLLTYKTDQPSDKYKGCLRLSQKLYWPN